METEKEIRLLVYFIIVVLIFCVVYFLIYKKAFTENLQKNRQEFYALQKFLGEKEKTLEEFNKVAANYKLKEKSLGKINQLLLQKSENKLLVLIHFDLLAAQNGMAIENFSFEPIESSESGVGILPVNLTVKGTYLNFKEFLDDISESIPLMEVSKISFSSDSGSSKIYSFSLRIDIYTEDIPESQENKTQEGEQQDNQQEKEEQQNQSQSTPIPESAETPTPIGNTP